MAGNATCFTHGDDYLDTVRRLKDGKVMEAINTTTVYANKKNSRVTLQANKIFCEILGNESLT